jgi:multidrug transporter EmrE-like cation transporter
VSRLLLFASCIVAVVADMLFVWWAKEESHPIPAMVLGLVLLNIASVVWMYTMREGIESATAITFYALFTVAGCSFLGFVVFKEHLSPINVTGLALSVVALVFISL